MAKTHLTAAQVREELDYNPETGHFIRRKPRPGAQIGAAAGWTNTIGYKCVSLFRSSYLQHRVAWIWMTGEWPKGVVDHINGDPGDNRWTNLRDISHQANIHNQRKAAANNKSTGLLGVTIHKPSGLFFFQIKLNRKRVAHGYFKTPQEAHEAYIEAKRRIHAEGCTL